MAVGTIPDTEKEVFSMRDAAQQPWNVYFDGNFWSRSGKTPCDTELKIGKTFQYAGRTWLLPSLHLCEEGLVADLCMATDNETLAAFMRKWNLSMDESQNEGRSAEEEMRLRAEHPLFFPCHLRLSLAGALLPYERGCQTLVFSDVWKTAPKEETEQAIAAHYALDSALNWTVYRFAFRWNGARPESLESLSAAIVPGSVSLPGPRFSAGQKGEQISFVHPFTGAHHTLTAENFRWEKIPVSGKENGPALYAAVMQYRIAPPLPKDSMEVFDCADPSSIGICYAISAEEGPENLLTAFSTPRTAPADTVAWRLVLHGTKWENEWVSFL